MQSSIRALAATSLALALSSPALASDIVFDRDPVGESAYYEIDRSGGRTSNIVRGGNLSANVVSYDPSASPPVYDVRIDYTFRIQFLGTRSGSQTMQFDDAFFTEQFMADLRRNGEYYGTKFKVRYLGVEDARNMDGRFYPACDRILIYDVDTFAASPLIDVAREMLGFGNKFDEIENLEIKAHIKYGVPVLGAVKLDITGRYNGVDIKAGSDYRAP